MVFKSFFNGQDIFNNIDNSNLIKNGCPVILKNIKNEKYNNKYGTISGYNHNKLKYLINIHGNNILVNRINIQQIVNCKIVNLKNKDHYNGKTGQVIGYFNERFLININNSKISLKSENIILNKDTNVKLINLKTTHLNNKYGNILSFSNNRYSVKLNFNSIVKIKPVNIMI